MNYNSGKSIIIITIIIFVFIISFFFFKMLNLKNEVILSSENIPVKPDEATVDDQIDLDLLESNKFINLKADGGGSAVFKAGRRNPFKPYE